MHACRLISDDPPSASLACVQLLPLPNGGNLASIQKLHPATVTASAGRSYASCSLPYLGLFALVAYTRPPPPSPPPPSLPLSGSAQASTSFDHSHILPAYARSAGRAASGYSGGLYSMASDTTASTAGGGSYGAHHAAADPGKVHFTGHYTAQHAKHQAGRYGGHQTAQHAEQQAGRYGSHQTAQHAEQQAGRYGGHQTAQHAEQQAGRYGGHQTAQHAEHQSGHYGHQTGHHSTWQYSAKPKEHGSGHYTAEHTSHSSDHYSSQNFGGYSGSHHSKHGHSSGGYHGGYPGGYYHGSHTAGSYTWGSFSSGASKPFSIAFALDPSLRSITGRLSHPAKAGVHACADIFAAATAAKLGPPSSCTVVGSSSGASELRISLGLDASIVPGDLLELSATGQLLSSTQPQHRLRGSFALLGCGQGCAEPLLSISAPLYLAPSCSQPAAPHSLVLDARRSMDASGRQLAAVTWAVDLPGGNLPALKAAVDAVNRQPTAT